MLSFFLCAALLTISAAYPCPPEWTEFEQSCYVLITEPRNFQDAQTHCLAMDAFLAEVSNQGENEFIKNLASINDAIYVWLGATDLIREGRFYWTKTNRAVGSSGFSDWWPGQPDDSNNEDCMHIRMNFQGKWNDAPCTMEAAFVCQKYDYEF